MTCGTRTSFQNCYINLVEIINNPDFDRFEYLKYLKLHNSNSTSLANKTIHILPNKMSINLLESIMLVLSARPSIKIVLDFSRMVLAQSERFWRYFLRRSEILSKMNIEIVSTMLQNIDMSQETNNLYIILDRYDEFKFEYCTKTDEIIRGKFIVIDYRYNYSELWSKDIDKKCKAIYGNNISFRYVDREFDLGDHLIDEISKAGFF